MMRVVTFKIEEELLEAVDLAAKSKGKLRSELIRDALKFYLLKHGFPLRVGREAPLPSEPKPPRWLKVDEPVVVRTYKI